eukprot:3777155-Rhodomonas_salina.1
MIDPPRRYQLRPMPPLPAVGDVLWARFHRSLDLRRAVVVLATSALDITVQYDNGTRGTVSRLESLHPVTDLQRLWMD